MYHKNMFLFTLTDPLAHNPQKALDIIGNALQQQYEKWQPRVRLFVNFIMLFDI